MGRRLAVAAAALFAASATRTHDPPPSWAAIHAAIDAAASSTGSNCSGAAAVCAPPTLRSPLAALGSGSHPYPRTVYAEHSGKAGQGWAERINTAIQTTMLSSRVVLPLGTFPIETPIMVWMLRNDSAGVNTLATNIPLAKLGEAWAAISGGTPQDLAQGLTIQGQGGGGQAGQLTTNMVWKGAEDQVLRIAT